MITDDSQRMTERRVTWRRPGRELFNPAAHDVELLDAATATAFVERHHYAGSCSPPAHPFGLYCRGELVGGAVYGPLPSMNAHRKVFPTLGTTEGVTLGRFVLTERAGYNAESWFVARCHERLPARGVVAVESCADPVPRCLPDGRMIKPGHIGTIYKASNGAYVGRTNAATLRILPDGTCLSNRAQGKLVRGERGEGRAVAQLVRWGADPLRAGEDVEAWLERWRSRLTRSMRHPGNYRYLWCLDKRQRRNVMRFPTYAYPTVER